MFPADGRAAQAHAPAAMRAARHSPANMMVISEKRCTIEINDALVFARSRFFRFVIVVPVISPLPAVG